MGFRKTFSRENTNGIQKVCMVVGLIAFLRIGLWGIENIVNDELGIILLVLIASSVTFYLFKK